MLYAERNQQKSRGEILISDKTNIKTKVVTRAKEGHYIIIKGSVQKEEIIINMYVPNTGAL